MFVGKFVLRHRSTSRIAVQCVKLGVNTNVNAMWLQPQACSFRTTTVMYAKAKKDSKSSDAEPTPLPDLKNADAHMERVIAWLTGELAKVQVGKLGVDAFGEIKVPSYGTVSAAGQLTMKGPTRINVAIYDPEMVTIVATAIRESGLGVNPTVEGNNLLINIPKPSQEARDMMQKALSKIVEKAKLDVRNVRKDTLDAQKKSKAGHPEDALKRHTKEVETLTEKKVAKIEKLHKDKEKEFN